ncbi:MAG: squalene/phytoene synthase family protein [Pseudomonadota bacterium]
MTDLAACAGIVERGDPDRFMATMAAPPEARRVLFPLYAFNVEVSRAPYVTQEPLLAEMRLQWWADALDEIQSGGPVRKHEVTVPLAHVLTGEDATLLQACIDARRRDAQREALSSHHDLRTYVQQTAGVLHQVATRALGARSTDQAAIETGSALGLANYLLAVPAFLARGINPLPAMTEAEMSMLLTDHLTMLNATSGHAPKEARIANLAAWRARGVLRRAMKDQSAIVDDRLGGSEFARRAALFWRSLRV